MFQFADIMVWEVVTPAVLSTEPKYNHMQEDQPQAEHTGNLRGSTSLLSLSTQKH